MAPKEALHATPRLMPDNVSVTADAAWLARNVSDAGSLVTFRAALAEARHRLDAALLIPGQRAPVPALNAATALVCSAPLRVHLCAGAGSWSLDASGELNITAHSFEAALGWLCTAALAGGEAASLAAAAPVFGTLLADSFRPAATGRSALCGGGGEHPARLRSFRASNLLAAASAPAAARAGRAARARC